MDLNDLVQKGLDYYQTNPVAAVAVAVIVLFLLFRKPKLLLVIILIAVAAVGMNYLFAKLSKTGLEHKKVPFFNK